MTAYATIDDLMAVFETAPKTARQPRLEGLLQVATDELNTELKRDYFRHPTSGATTWLVDGEGGCTLHLHRGIVELELVELSWDYGLTFVELAATDWVLTWEATTSDAPLEGEPYFHLRLLPTGTYRTFPRGTGVIRLTGARGWATIPAPLIEGVVERARQTAFADGSYSGAVAADDEYGRAISSYPRWPDVTWKFMERERRRFYACEA
jgi:hypothetical protein